MKIISHRGNLEGSNFVKENTKKYIDIALDKSFDVEIDLWKVNNEFFLGHDKPLYKVSFDWLAERKNKLWIHTKNFSAFESLLETKKGFIFFYYASEPLVLVSNGKIWTHTPKKIMNPKNYIVPLLSKIELENTNFMNWHAVCTDFPNLLLEHPFYIKSLRIK